jgi:hypothetical protein
MEAVVLIVAIVMIGKVMSGGRWNRETRRWERHSPDNPYVRMGQIDEAPQLRKDIARLQERVATLEKLAVDPARSLSDEIEQLRVSSRAMPPAARAQESPARSLDS